MLIGSLIDMSTTVATSCQLPRYLRIMAWRLTKSSDHEDLFATELNRKRWNCVVVQGELRVDYSSN